jgi:methyltransferase (TIGR00027 family)
MSRRPSQTALISASHRALHQSLDGGAIFRDPFAVSVLGSDAEPFLEQARDDPFRSYWALHFAGRSRFAEDAAEAALDKGVQQIVILGAGYDTYAYRCKAKPDTLIFEVDQQATQLRKLERLARAGIPIPQTLTFVAVDFEHEALADRLIEAGFEPALPSFFIWLGVTYYLTEESVAATLCYLGSLPAAEIVLDYVNPLPEVLPPEIKAFADAVSDRAAALGEPIRTRPDTESLHADMKKFRLHVVEDLAPVDIFSRFNGQIVPGMNPDSGWRFLHAATPQQLRHDRYSGGRLRRAIHPLRHQSVRRGHRIIHRSKLQRRVAWLRPRFRRKSHDF